ncbi:MAG: TRAP transporter substrate-binding protein DctP [Thermodesulfobacteriota bacterium]|nr:TRAP transporter substrate-binding protein DctP [Thermodesulfobacteriota bacterium]
MPKIISYLVLVVLLSIPVSGWSVTFKIATVAPEGSQWMQQMRMAAIAIKERTEGRVQLKFYGGGVMGNEKSVLRKMRMGQLHGSAFTGGGLGKINQDVLLYGLPLLTRSAEEMTYLRQQMDTAFIDTLAQSGFISFGFAGGGFANLMSQAPIKGVADMKGLKVWVPEGDRVSYAVMEALGLAPVTLPLSDVLTGLQTGLVEVVGTSPLGALAFQWYTRVNYITPMPLAYIFGSLVIDKRRFERLSAVDQGVMRDVLSVLYRNFDQQNALDDSGALHALQGEGLKIIQPLNGEYEHWEAVAGKVVRGMVKQGLFSAELYEQIQEHLQHYRQLPTQQK